MSASLPKLPDRTLIADLCREVAAREGMQPELVEKDLYLTRLLWAVGQELEANLVLKGGTLLSKVDLGFYRMSEDADLVIPGTPDRSRRANAQSVNRVRDALKALSPAVGVRAQFPGGEISERGAHATWQLDYDSDFGRQGVRLEVSIRPVLRPPRQVVLRQLLADPLAGDYSQACCWALAADEARAEKVRAAFTRDAIRDFYDLDRMMAVKADFASKKFLHLVDAKLAELNEAPLAAQPATLGVTAARRRVLDAALRRDLPAVLRLGAPSFDLDAMLARFERVWRR